jgi:hypothetical protein
MKKINFEKKQNEYRCLGHDILRDLKTYPIEKIVEIAIARFDTCKMQYEILEKIKKEYCTKDEIAKRVLEYHINLCQSDLHFFNNYLVTKINDIHDSSPNKEKLIKKIKSRNLTEQIDDLANLPVFSTKEEWKGLSILQKINFLVSDYRLDNLIMFKERKLLKKMYTSEKFKHYEKAFLEYDYQIITENASKLYESACYYYFLELPLDYTDRKQIKKYILGSENIFYLPILRRLLYTGKDGPAFECIDYALDPDSRDYYDTQIYEVDTIYEILSVHTYNELINDKIDVIDILLSQHPIFRSTVNKLPPHVFSRRRELISEIIKAEIVNYKKFDIRDPPNE